LRMPCWCVSAVRRGDGGDDQSVSYNRYFCSATVQRNVEVFLEEDVVKVRLEHDKRLKSADEIALTPLASTPYHVHAYRTYEIAVVRLPTGRQREERDQKPATHFAISRAITPIHTSRPRTSLPSCHKDSFNVNFHALCVTLHSVKRHATNNGAGARNSLRCYCMKLFCV